MPSARRLLTLGGAAFVGLAATALLAAPASAHKAELTGKSACDPKSGTFSVTWTLTNKFNQHATLSDAVFEFRKGRGGFQTGTGQLTVSEIKASKTSKVGVQTGVPANSVARLKLHVRWDDGHTEDVVGNDEPCGQCKPEGTPSSPAPQPSASTSPVPVPSGSAEPVPSGSASPGPSGGTGGGGGSPSPSPAKPAPPSLPVTGSQAAIYGGGSALLLSAGGGLFWAARRRRITFEA